MKLYLLSQDDNNSWDTYDSILVCASDPEDAKSIDPSGSEFTDHNGGYFCEWAKEKKNISCVEIGTANENIGRGVIIASFNAG